MIGIGRRLTAAILTGSYGYNFQVAVSLQLQFTKRLAPFLLALAFDVSVGTDDAIDVPARIALVRGLHC
jgi:hypothetical protein